MMSTSTTYPGASIVKYDSVLAADYLRALAIEKGLILNVTKVQKILYIVYGFMLAQFDRVVFNECPKAWPYGPVFPRTRENVDYSRVVQLNDPRFEHIRKDSQLTEVMTKVIEAVAEYTATQLSDWSHKPDSPWDITVKSSKEKWNTIIPDELISTYFKTLALA